jgi:hypothetical protein
MIDNLLLIMIDNLLLIMIDNLLLIMIDRKMSWAGHVAHVGVDWMTKCHKYEMHRMAGREVD